MSLKAKYQPIIDLLKELEAENIIIREENGSLIITGNVKNIQEKELLQKKIQQVNPENAMDIDLIVGMK